MGAFFRIIVLSCLMIFVACKSTQKAATERSNFIDVANNPSLRDIGKEAYLLVDGQAISRNELMQKYRPDDIAFIDVYTQDKAVKLYGIKAEDGAANMTTIPEARRLYQARFSERSTDYATKLASLSSDASFLYVLNKRPLFKKIEKRLCKIEVGKIKSIRIKDQKYVRRKFKDQEKQWAILIDINE